MVQNISRRGFLSVSTTGVMAAAVADIPTPTPQKIPWETRLIISNRAELRMLQFTDIHFFNGATRRPEREKQKRNQTLDDARRLIDHAKPDVLLITGDVWHDNPDGRGAEFMNYAIEQFASWGVPWAFTWGNHDQLDNYNAAHKVLAEAKHSLYGGIEKDGNYVVTFENRDGTCLAEIFCLNTRDTGIDKMAQQFIHEAAVTLDTRHKRPMRLGAFHIPIKQYKDVWDNDTARGIIGENVCMEKEDGTSLPILAAAGIQAVFCGHDHVNDYAGSMEGVDLIYGRTTGHNGYGTSKVPKGAKLYALDPALKTLEWASLLPDGTTWKPGTNERKDTRRSS